MAASFTDAAYTAAGATVVEGAADAWAADLVLKLNPPTAVEAALLGSGQVCGCVHGRGWAWGVCVGEGGVGASDPFV